MKNIIEKFRALPAKHQLVIAVVVFILALFILPAPIAYAVGAFASYKLIDKKVWKYIATVFFCSLALVSAMVWIAGDTTQTQIGKDATTPQVEQNTEKINENTRTSTDVQEKATQPTSGNVPMQIAPTSPTILPAMPPVIPSPTSQGFQKAYDVVKVIDGDTVSVSIDGKVEVLRLIGIDTPETVDPRKPVECFGVEASNKAKSLLSGKKVSLEDDVPQGERDKYGRLLRYVFLEDGTNFNFLMIKEGYAHEYTYNLPYKYQSEFKKAQKEAMESKAGLWGDVCQQQTVTPSVTPPTIPAPTPVPSGAYSLPPCASLDCDCGDFSTHAYAQWFHDNYNDGDKHRLDKDKDGLVCEGLP